MVIPRTSVAGGETAPTPSTGGKHPYVRTQIICSSPSVEHKSVPMVMLSYSDEMKLYIQLCHSSKAYLIYNSKKLYVPEYAFQAYTKLFVSKFEQLINLSVIAICPVSQ